MDPSIMKLLEEDEDETMHSGADVEAFTAALNRDIEGDTSAASQPSDSDSAPLSQGSNHNSSQLFPPWHSSSQDENANGQNHQVLNGSQKQEQRFSEMELKQRGSGPENRSQDTSQELNRIPLQQKQPQDEHQHRKVEQNILHFPQTTGMQNPEKNPAHISESETAHNPQKMNNQQPMAAEQLMNRMKHGKQVPFALLLPVLLPQLDKDRGMQLHTVYIRLKKNEITKDAFVHHMRAIVGDQMLKMAVYKLQAQVGTNWVFKFLYLFWDLMQKPQQAARNSQTGPNKLSLQSQASGQQQQGNVPQPFAQLHQRSVTSTAMMDNGQKSREMERQSDSPGMLATQTSASSLSSISQERVRPPIPVQGLTKQQQQHLHFSQASFPIDGSTGGNYHPFSGANVSTSTSSLKQQPNDSQMRHGPVHQNIGATQLGTSSQGINAFSAPKFERQSPFGEPKTLSSMAYVKQEPIDQGSEQQLKSRLSFPQGLSSFHHGQAEHGNEDEALEMQSSRMGFSASTSMMPSNSVSSSMAAQLDPTISLNSRITSATSSIGPGNNAKTPPKKPSIGQKKPLESLVSSPPLSSKKQKVSGAFSDQSIEQLNDVTAVSGVNIREEEEQLLSGPKEDSRVSEASRRVVQEEEERLILQKIPLQKKLAEIISKCGLRTISNDVERCLSLCVEERMRGLISNLIRLSKQRVDMEKPRHRTLVTSDVKQQILAINQKARDDWDKKQTEAEKLQKLNEPEGKQRRG